MQYFTVFHTWKARIVVHLWRFLDLIFPRNNPDIFEILRKILSNGIKICRRSEFNVIFFFNEEPMPMFEIIREILSNRIEICRRSEFNVDFFSTRNQCQGDDFPTEPIVSSSSLLFIKWQYTLIMQACKAPRIKVT